MIEKRPHICVCICTYKRPRFLKRLLEELRHQDTEGLFSYSIVVADNDQSQSAKEVVEGFRATSTIEVVYCVEPRQNISLTRNKALENAKGNYIAFIDDDEYPVKDWLLILFKTCIAYGVDGVLGPVKPHFEEQPPKWVIKGKFHQRATYNTGFVIDWRKGRTGNVLLKRRIFDSNEQAFNPAFLTGEDQDFFRRMIQMKGHVFIWCNEAIAYEEVPPIRWKLSYMIRKALFRGKVSLNHPTFRGLDIARSIMAVLIYAMALPFLFFLGWHMVVRYLEKFFDHIGKILAFLGFCPVKAAYITE